MNKVMILRNKDYNDSTVYKMLESIFENVFDIPDRKIDTLLIKPNMMYYWDSSTGETTDPKIVSMTIDILRNYLGENLDISVVESDASAMRTKYAFEALGYYKMCEEKDVNLVNLSDGKQVSKIVKLNREDLKIKVNPLLLSADYFINIPKLKVHRDPPVLSCALKNYFGLISTKYKYQFHRNLNKYVAAINKLVRQDLIIVDGLVSLGKYPKKLGLMIGSDDPISCDVLASKIVNRNYRNDVLISTAIEEKLGNPVYQLLDPQSVLVDICKDFPKMNPFVSTKIWDLQLFLLRTYAKLTGDILPPVLQENY